MYHTSTTPTLTKIVCVHKCVYVYIYIYISVCVCTLFYSVFKYITNYLLNSHTSLFTFTIFKFVLILLIYTYKYDLTLSVALTQNINFPFFAIDALGQSLFSHRPDLTNFL